MNKIKKIAIFQRICPHYRLPVFTELAKRCNYSYIIYFGKGQNKGSLRNANTIKGFEHKQLFTISLSLRLGIRDYYFVFHPSIFFLILRGKYDIVISEGVTNIINATLIFILCKIKNIPFIWWGVGNVNGTNSFLKKLVFPLERFLFSRANSCIAYCEAGKDYFIINGVKPENVFIAQNSIDEKKINNKINKYKHLVNYKKKELNIFNKKVILCTSTITKRKKLENLILAFQKIFEYDKDIVLLIMGYGPYLANLKIWVKNLHLPGILFLGAVWDEDPIYYLMADIFVLPSHGGLAINEAMVYGLPVIASSADGTEKDLIRHGENGLIVREDNILDLKNAISLILYNTDLRNKMSEKSKYLVDSKYNLENMVNGIVNAVDYVIET